MADNPSPADEIAELVARLRNLAKVLGTGHFDIPGHLMDAATALERVSRERDDLIASLRIYETELGMADTRISSLEAQAAASVEAAKELEWWIAVWDRVCDEADPDDDNPLPKWEIVRLAMMPYFDPLDFPTAEYFSSYMKADLIYKVRDFVRAPSGEAR